MGPRRVLLLLIALAGVVAAGLLILDARHAFGVGPGAAPGAAPSEPQSGPADDPSAAATRESVPRPTAPAISPVPAAAESGEPCFSGRVVDTRGKPIPGALVAAMRDSGLAKIRLTNVDATRLPTVPRTEAVTDADGRFRIPVRPGRHRLLSSARSFAPDERSVTARDKPTDLGDIVLQDSVVLAGRVVDAIRRPVGGAVLRRIDVTGRPVLLSGGVRGLALATTDGGGAFRIEEVASGPWRLLVTAEDHPDKIFSGETPRPGASVTDLELALDSGGEISGRVDQAIPGEVIWVEALALPADPPRPVDQDLVGVPRRASCAPDGSFVLRGVDPDTAYRITARDAATEDGPTSRTDTVEARTGATGIVLVATPRAALVCKVVDDSTGEPITEFEVRSGQTYLVPETDAQGKVQHHFPEGRVRIANLLAGATPQKISLVIAADGYQELRVDDVLPVVGKALDLGVLRLEK